MNKWGVELVIKHSIGEERRLQYALLETSIANICRLELKTPLKHWTTYLVRFVILKVLHSYPSCLEAKTREDSDSIRPTNHNDLFLPSVRVGQ